MTTMIDAILGAATCKAMPEIVELMGLIADDGFILDIDAEVRIREIVGEK